MRSQLTGLLGKGESAVKAGAGAGAEGSAGTWPTTTPRGAHTMEARDGDPPPAIAALLERAAAGALTEEELTVLELNSTERRK